MYTSAHESHASYVRLLPKSITPTVIKCLTITNLYKRSIMSSSIFFLLSTLLLASHVSATTLAPRSIHELLTRQSTFDPNIIPAQCRDTCGILTSTIATCQSSTVASCGCSATEERGFVICLNCILGTGTPSQEAIDNTQAFVDQYVILCNRAGVALPATTISGGVTEITSTPAAGSNTVRPTSVLLTRTPISAPQTTFAAPNPTETGDDSAATPSPGNPLSGLNSASRTRGRETAGAAVAAVVALVVFF